MKKTQMSFLFLILALFLVACTPNNNTKKVETKNETKTESTSETKKENKNDSKVVDIKDKDRKNDNKVTDSIDTSKSANDAFKNKITEDLQKVLKDFDVTLIAGQDVTSDMFPKENFQAIAKFENNNSFGYIVRYGVNRIGLLQYHKESTTGIMNLTDSKLLLKLNENPIKNDTVEEFKEISIKISEYVKKELDKNTKFDFAF